VRLSFGSIQFNPAEEPDWCLILTGLQPGAKVIKGGQPFQRFLSIATPSDQQEVEAATPGKPLKRLTIFYLASTRG